MMLGRRQQKVLVRLGVVLGGLVASATSMFLFVYFYSSAGPPVDKSRVKAVGILRHDGVNYLFTCLGGVIESTEIVPASEGKSLPGLVWRVDLAEPAEAEPFLALRPEIEGYEVEGTGRIEAGDSFAISSIRTSAGSAGPYRLHFDSVELSDGQAVMGDGEILELSDLASRFPDCALPGVPS